MHNAVILPLSDDNGKQLECAVFLYLRRHTDSMQKITYFNEGCECDFVVQREEHIEPIIQVCWTMSEAETRSRELCGMKTATDITGCHNCLIINFEKEDDMKYAGLPVKVLPA